MRLAFAVFLAVATLLLAQGRAEACKCVAPGSPEEERDRAEAVFVAKVARIQERERKLIVQMTVTRAFKGTTTGASITLHTRHGGADCGVRFDTASSWLVYAFRANGGGDDPGYTGLYATTCSRTTSMDSSAQEDLDVLTGKTSTPPKVPAAAPSDAPALLAPIDTVPPASSAPPTASTTAPTNAAPPPGSKGCACDAAPRASFGALHAALFALACFVAVARRRA
jgi:hypothetical protein